MARINFMKLIIASPSEETAKIICFESDLNVITSNRKKGNDLGKSVITKSLYHCMGADCKFDDKFDVNSKVFRSNTTLRPMRESTRGAASPER